MDNNIENIINETLSKNKTIITKKGLMIKEEYVNTLKKYGIDVSLYSSYSDILFLINDFINNCEDLEDDEYDELDQIANEIGERQYYENTNK